MSMLAKATGAVAVDVGAEAALALLPGANSSSSPSSGSGANPNANASASASGSNSSAVYRWYEIEEGFGAKRREESSVARCRLCRQMGKQERKASVRFSKSVTSNLWRHLKENHPDVYDKHAGEKKSVQMHRTPGKKRGRKKQQQQQQQQAKQGLADAIDADKLLDGHEELDLERLAKKTRRGDQYLADAVAGTQLAIGQQALPRASVNVERVREALGNLFLYELVPFELCSSPAFRNLLIECSGGAAGFIDDASSYAILSEDVARLYTRKLAADVRMRTSMLMKMTDFAHYVVSEWPVCVAARGTPVRGAVQNSSTDRERSFLAFIAVGLDQEFNPFRRCLHVSMAPADFNAGAHAVDSRGEDPLKAMAERGIPYKFMPQLLGVESSCEYSDLCSNYHLQFVESVPTLLLEVMVATINEVHVTDTYGLSKSVLSAQTATAGLVLNRRLDKDEFIESSILPDGMGLRSSHSASREDDSTPTVLDELPASITGHTYRDLIHKVLFLAAHFKESSTARSVLLRLALDDGKMDAETFEQTFVANLRATAVSVNNIYAVLCLVLSVMTPVSKYFELHRTSGDSDRAKLLQLCSLTKYEWSRASYLKSVLKPFAEATAKLDGEKYVVSSLIVPSVYTLLEKLRSPGSDDTKKAGGDDFPEDIQALRALAYANLAAAFGYLFSVPDSTWPTAQRQMFNLLWSATLLDPRTRPFIMKGSLPQHEFWDIIKAEASVTSDPKHKERDLVDAGLSLDDDGPALGADGAKTGDIWDDLQANLASCAQEEMLLSTSKSSLELAKSSNLLEVEVSFFQEEGLIPLKGNPLEWWQGMRMKYPFLARLARYVLSIPYSVGMSDNPVAADKGLLRRAVSQMSSTDLCELLAASMNLRAEKSVTDTASKQMWSTV